MSGPGEPPHSFSILEHYSGFDTTDERLRFDRRESEHSLQSSNASSSQQHGNTYHGRRGNSPHLAPSRKGSSTSSLRHTVAMLQAGIYPPGLQQRRNRLDSDSDASHYDDEEDDHGFDVGEGNGPFETVSRSGGSKNASLHHEDPYDEDDVFSNAPDSPSVPRRVSSVSSGGPPPHSRSPAKRGSPMEGGSGKNRKHYVADTGIDGSISSLIGSNIPSPTSSSNRSPGEKTKNAKTEVIGSKEMATTLSKSSSTTSPTIEKDLEKQLALAVENDDPNRPKTLKEARALAKERAKLRLQAREASDGTILGPSGISPTRPTAIERPTRAPQRESFQSDRSLYSNGETREGKGPAPSRTSVDWKGHSRQRATPVTPGEETEGLQLARSTSDQNNESAQGTMMASTSSTMAMEDLKSAVGEAIEDVSFASSATSSTTIPLGFRNSAQEDIPGPRLDIPSKSEVEIGSSNQSATSFDSARESPALSGIMSITTPSWAAPEVPKAIEEEYQPPSMQTTPLPNNDYEQLPSSNTQNSFPSSGTFSSDANSPNHRFVPHTLHAQQRSTAPNKIARLDVYGKTVPWPPAFNPLAIIDQRRLAPWERARSYAHYCNDLIATPTGLMVWLEMVQRPAHRIVPEPSTPGKRHVRGEGTDHSTYAASVRSDATFPTRGDGGKAKELMSNIPATINESPPSTLPTNIPYPILVQQPSRGSSSSQDELNSSSTMASDRDRSAGGLGRSGNFFSSLGRKGSTRRTPGSGSMSGFSPLSSTGAGTVRGAMRGKGKTISNPMSLTSSHPVQNLKSVNESMTPSEPISNLSSSSIQQSKIQAPSSPTHSTPSVRMPMGPRAPVSGGGPFPNTSIPQRDRLGSVGGDSQRITPYGLSTTGGIYSIPAGSTATAPVLSGSPTDYSDGKVISPLSPPLTSVKSSFSYNSVREKSPGTKYTSQLQPPGIPTRNSSDSSNTPRSRRGSNQDAQITSAENEALDKLGDVLPDADRSTLLEYLRRANGNDLIAIGDYLQAQSKNEGKHYMR